MITKSLAMLALWGGPLFLAAATIKGGEKVIIDQPVSENLYVAGGEVTVNAPVAGDLIVAGGKIWVNADIQDDVWIGGGEAEINGIISGDLRVAGGKIKIMSNISGDLIVAGGELEVGDDVTIGGDLMIFGGELDFSGTVNGMVRTAGGDVSLTGVIAGGINAKAGELKINAEVQGLSSLAAQTITLGSGTRFLGDVEYWQRGGELDFSSYLGPGVKATFNPELKLEKGDFSDFKKVVKRGMFALSIFRFLSGIVLIILLVLLFNRFFDRNAGHLRENVGGNLGYGILYLIGMPILAIIAFVSIIGIPVGFVLAAGYGITLVLAGALAAVIFAYEIKKSQHQQWGTGTMLLVSIGISLLFRLVDFIPFVGGLVLFLIVATVLGYLYQVLRQSYFAGDKTAEPMDPDIV